MPANKVPSGNSTITEALDELLDIIVGGSEKEEHLLKQISSKLNKSTLGKIINDSLSVQIELLSTAANMLTAIAGYLYGEKGLGLNTSAAQLLGKVKNNSPILGDKPMSSEVAEEGGSKKSKDPDFSMLLELKGITGQDLWALKETIDALKEILGSDELDDVDVIVDMADILQQLVDALGKIKFGKVNSKFAEKVLDVGVVIDELQVINKKLVKGLPVFILMEACKDSITGFPKIIAELISGTNGKGGLVMIMNRINKAEENGLDPRILTDFFENVLSLMKVLSKVGLFAVIAGTFGKQVTKAMTLLKDIVEELSGLKIDAVIKSNKNVENAAKLIKAMREIFVGLALVGLLAIPALVGLLIIFVASKLLFKVIQTVADGLKGIGKIDDITANLKSIGIVVLTLGLLLVFAALTGGWVLEKATNILGFAIVLSGFIMLLMLPFAIFGKTLEKTIASAQEMCLLIAVCALVMMLGAVFMLTGLWKESLQFGAVLAVFMIAVFIPFVLLSIFMKKAVENAKEMSLLIVTCALTMMLGALFMKTGLWKEALLFGAVLTGFMLMVFLPFILLSLFMKRAIRSAKSMIYLIITCALVLMIGALFMLSGLWKEALMFGAILAVFIFLVVLPFGLFGRNLQKAMPVLLALTLLIVVSTIVLLIGATYVRDYGWEDALIFGGLLVLFIGIIGGAAILLAQFKKDLLIGLIAMAVISGIAVIFGIVIKDIAEAMAIADPGEMLAAVGIMALIILAIAGAAIALGVICCSGIGAVAFVAGIAAMAAVAGIAKILSSVMKDIGIAAVLITKATNEGFDIDKAMIIVTGMTTIANAVGAAGATMDLKVIKSTASSCMSMAMMISMIGNAVADISNLTVGTKWDSDGNAIEFRQLNNDDFTNAAENTKVIITTLGGAIIDLYGENPEMFAQPSAGGIAGFFGKKDKSPFDKVVISCTSLGRMISGIAEGVANMANLTVATAWNENGEPIKFRSLKYEDFSAAAENTKLIIKTLGGAICELYKENKELFEVPDVVTKIGFIKITKKGSGPTVFEKVVKACSSLGQMISSIAAGVGDMASLKVADAWNSSGEPISYRYLSKPDFDLASENISAIVKTLGAALTQTYHDNEEMFSTSLTFVDGKLQGDTPIIRVINAASDMGEMVSNLAGGVQDIANLRMPIKYNNKGEAIEWREVTDDDFVEAGVKVGLITTVLARALGDVYNRNPKLFDPVTTMVKTKDGWFSDEYTTHTEDAPMVKVLKAAGNLGQFVADCAKAVKEVGDLTFLDRKGNPIKITSTDLKPGGYIQKNIVSVVTCLPMALESAFDALPDGTLKTAQYFNDSLLPVIVKVTEQYKDIVIKNCEIKESDIIKGTNNFSLALTKLFKIFTDDKLVVDDTFERFLDKIKVNIATLQSIDIDSVIFENIDKILQVGNKLSSIKFNIRTENIEGLSKSIAYLFAPFAMAEGVKFQNIIAFEKISTPKNLAAINMLTKIVKDVNITKSQIDGFRLMLRSYFGAFNGRINKKNVAIISDMLAPTNIFGIKTLAKVATQMDKESAVNFLAFITSVKNSFEVISRAKFNVNRLDTFTEGILLIGHYGDKFIKTFETDPTKQLENYTKLVFGTLLPFKEIKNVEISKFKKTFSTKTVRNIDILNKSINKLDGGKVDKFIELSQELRELSDAVGDIGGLVDALNGRINETLVQLSESLDSASDTIKASDKIQDKRQKLIQKNTKELKAVLEKPMKLELSKAASSSAGSKSGGGGSKSSSSSSSSSSGGSSSAGGSIDTSTIETLLRNMLTELKRIK